ncbi:major facilitator superfamily domain-containing protein [Pseudomassariella vexata]|uniref:Major facilitator superfamily domain-containing protein n=1 Tax=Pseudomassariella vexata TaxID=1141098 RepID=A0A1Y2EE23_9PEZI|nr:major facilitator superfamily domain-containing protein [Pseudomassariella vexata]ORY69822.1 major facilitator superfamily domain-containing protein [Pseudomassariella vexata]
MDSRQRSAEKALHDQTDILPRAKLLVVFAALSMTLLIQCVDQNGIGVTLPTIAKDLNAANTISWAGTSSLIANTTFQMLYGRLSDIFGRKVVYLGAIALLSIAALLCGLSQNAAMFYVFRGVAGIGGGGITNLSMIIVSDTVTLEQRGKYQGIIGAFVGLGNVTGPFLAAAFIQKATWRAFFWMEAPLTALVGGVAWFLLPSKPRTLGLGESVRKIDYGGVLTSSVGVILLLIPISGGGSYFSWDSPMVISMLAIGSCALVLFVLIEWKVAKLPMMPLTIFKSPVVVVILTQSLFFGAVYQSYLYYLPMYFQNVRQWSVLTSAAYTSAVVLPQSCVSIVSGQYISWRKRYGEVLWSGFGCWTLGSGLTLLWTRNTHPVMVVIPLLLIGIGVGNVFQPTLVALQAHTPKSRRAAVISNRNFFRCAGGACGLAVSAAVLQAALRANLPTEYAHLADDAYALTHGQTLGVGGGEVLDAYMAASRAVFVLQVPLIGICLLGCVFIRDRGLEPIEDADEQLVGRGIVDAVSSVDDSNKAMQQPQEGLSLEEGVGGGDESAKREDVEAAEAKKT